MNSPALKSKRRDDQAPRRQKNGDNKKTEFISLIQDIIKNSDLAVEKFQELTDFEFGYNEESIEWLAGFINRQRERDDFSLELGKNMTNTIGSFLGQCIVKCHAGKWKETTEGWAVEFNDQNKVYPFNKTLKQFENGPEDSIYSFFTTIPIIFELTTGRPEKKWWEFWK